MQKSMLNLQKVIDKHNILCFVKQQKTEKKKTK